MAFRLESTAFKTGGMIPARYTCDGDNVSPPLTWSEPPPGTKSFALICDDPDAPMMTFVHWVIYAIPVEMTGLKEALPTRDTLDGGVMQGVGGFRRSGYSGPCPPGKSPHRYFFKLYALDSPPELLPGRSRKDLENAMKGHILGIAELMGLYTRS